MPRLCFTPRDPAGETYLVWISYGQDKIKEADIVNEHIKKEVMIVDPLAKGLASKLFNEHVMSVGVLITFGVSG